MDNQDKSSILQWLIPTGIMMVVVVAMLVSFFTKSSRAAEISVSKTLVSSVENYGKSFLHELALVGEAGEPICALLEKEGVQDSGRAAELLSVAVDCAEIEKAVYVDKSGVGFDQTGAPVDVGGEEWFQADALFDEVFPYFYTKEEHAVGVVRPVGEDAAQGYLLLFYQMERFADTLRQSGYDSAGALAVINMDGDVLGFSGLETNVCVRDGNLFDAVNARDDKNAANELQNRIRNGSRGSLSVKAGGQSQVLTFAPLAVNCWDMVLALDDVYVERQVDYLCKDTKNMMISLFVVIGVFFCIVMVFNIAGKIRSNAKKKELENKADTDLLTGLSNKLATERKIKDYMRSNPETQSMMFLFDIDNFKKINDTMGHAFGDEVLRSLGSQIGSIFRASDIVGRIGGDEFMVFLKDISNERDILKGAEKVETFFKSFQAGEYVKYKATASIGVAIFPQEGGDFESLYKAADQGLYKAKKRGKNQLAFYKDRAAKKLPAQEE